MKTVQLNDFMEKYRELEREIRNALDVDFNTTQGGPVAYYENELMTKDSTKAAKLRYLRTIRNISAHNPGVEDFIAVTDEHMKLLDLIIRDIQCINGCVADQYVTLARISALSPNDTIQTACEILAKRKTDTLYVVDEARLTFATITSHLIVLALASGKTKTTRLNKTDLQVFENPLINGVQITTPLNRIPEHKHALPVIKANKIVGVLR